MNEVEHISKLGEREGAVIRALTRLTTPILQEDHPFLQQSTVSLSNGRATDVLFSFV